MKYLRSFLSGLWGIAARHVRQAQCRPRRLNGGGVRIVGVVLLSLAVMGCEGKKAESSLPVTHMQIGGQTFNIEIATSFHDQEVGLMHRDHLDADHGMIFPMPMKVQTFWNHDVHFPLDVIFLDDKQDVVSIVRLEPYNDQGKSSGEPAEYAVELNAGTAKRLKIKVGDHLDVPKEAVFQQANGAPGVRNRPSP